MPELASNNKDAVNKLACFEPSLLQPFPGTAFNSTTFRFGPSEGFDRQPAVWPTTSMIAVTSVGNYNSKLGGHLVLKEWKVVIEIRPCSTALIPAMITRGVVPIASQERQVSLIQHATAPFRSGAAIPSYSSSYPNWNHRAHVPRQGVVLRQSTSLQN